MQKDQLYGRDEGLIAEFAFNDATAAVFEDMLGRSVQRPWRTC